jgi:hypothetical protein
MIKDVTYQSLKSWNALRFQALNIIKVMESKIVDGNRIKWKKFVVDSVKKRMMLIKG